MSDCSCIDTSNDDGYSVCLSQKIVKATSVRVFNPTLGIPQLMR